MVNFVTWHKNELYKFIYYCSIFFQIESLLDIIPETALSCTDERTYEERSVEENIELM